jgi:Zn finger protein HypA/HybF involved in hydrogenase expression
MRWLIVFVVVAIGCVASLPPDDVTVSADLAAEAARMVVKMRSEISPAPKPVDERCSNCNGTGKIGDGRIVMQCPECGGTGKR